MVHFLIARHSSSARPTTEITPPLYRAMYGYHWPGNVRELENVVRKLIVLRDPDLIAKELFMAARAGRPAGDSGTTNVPSHEGDTEIPILQKLERVNQKAEAETILAALHSARWNRKRAASMLNIDYKALLYKMKKLGLERD